MLCGDDRVIKLYEEVARKNSGFYVIDQRNRWKVGDFNARRDAHRGIVLRLVLKLRAPRTREAISFQSLVD